MLTTVYDLTAEFELRVAEGKRRESNILRYKVVSQEHDQSYIRAEISIDTLNV